MQQDKLKHAAFGFAAAVVGLLAVAMVVPEQINGLMGGHGVARAMVFCALCAGLGKELLDDVTGGDVDPMDVVATVVGGVAAAMFVVVVVLINK